MKARIEAFLKGHGQEWRENYRKEEVQEKDKAKLVWFSSVETRKGIVASF